MKHDVKWESASTMRKGNEIFSVHSGHRFAIEYVSYDGNSFVLTSVENDSLSRCYTRSDINRSFKKVIKLNVNSSAVTIRK